ncbi:MAG: hypothetical protein J1F35_05020 [Erysipelotrichales bacterium]|nr:hypothetical protein [Erysipelotrichales bacterium]
MKYNREYDINKTKISFFGFIIGIAPFLIVLGVIGNLEGEFEYIPSLFKETLIIAALLTALLNSVILKKMYMGKTRASLTQ